ncbi:MAG: 3-deoxy-8-phosphooctulonate synthase [Acidobacteria bacterium]|nr:3-deoxy-8-phosphooctulonate synthase [Acidobacteriota bacterium]
MRTVDVGGVRFGAKHPLALIAGPCVIESAAHATEMAQAIDQVSARVHMPYVFKASFDKANRTSLTSFRGPGLARGLDVLAAIKQRLGCPILTDIHEPAQAAPVAEVADVLQIPAFLCRQTDLIVSAAATGRAVNLKKGQFLAPLDMRHAIAKATAGGNHQVLVTERGTAFGYHDLVVDMRSFPQLRSLHYPVVYDVTHSLQLPGGGDGVTAGQAEFIEPLAAAGVAAGIDGLFFEVHDRPAAARSDGQNALPLARLEPLLRRLVAIRHAAHPSAIAAEAE